MISDKTASLIAASSECAAILGGLDSEKYRDYGENLGIAFQVVDDMLDVAKKSDVDIRFAKNVIKEIQEKTSVLKKYYQY